MTAALPERAHARAACMAATSVSRDQQADLRRPAQSNLIEFKIRFDCSGFRVSGLGFRV